MAEENQAGENHDLRHVVESLASSCLSCSGVHLNSTTKKGIPSFPSENPLVWVTLSKPIVDPGWLKFYAQKRGPRKFYAQLGEPQTAGTWERYLNDQFPEGTPCQVVGVSGDTNHELVVRGIQICLRGSLSELPIGAARTRKDQPTCQVCVQWYGTGLLQAGHLARASLKTGSDDFRASVNGRASLLTIHAHELSHVGVQYVKHS